MDDKILLICIGRQENVYITEFVEYYKELGVDNIIICDNNHNDEEHFEDVLEPYLKSGFVVIENVRNRTACQISVYNEMFNKYKNLYDWIMFFDCDEFLTIKPNNSVREFLSDEKFQDKDAILVNWMMYDDNDLITFDGRGGVLERFTRPCRYDIVFFNGIPENNLVKSIVHSKNFKPQTLFGTHPGYMHCPQNTKNKCNAIGELISETTPFVKYNFDRAYLRHYRYKTIEEFVEKKLLIQTPDRFPSRQNQRFLIDCFFKINKMTEEKINYLSNFSDIIDIKGFK